MTTAQQLRQTWIRIAAAVLGWFGFGVVFLSTVGALFNLLLLPYAVRTVLAALYFVAVPLMLWQSRNAWSTRIATMLSCAFVYLLLLTIRPSNDRTWAPDQARVAGVHVDDGIVTIANFRHCRYRTESDFDTKFLTKRFPLANINSVWFIVQKFSPAEGLAHVFLSFGLKGETQPSYFSVSVEIRREVGESYSPIRGLYRHYELTHVIGDERDLIGVRTIHRPHDRVFLYQINASAQQAQQLFLEFSNRITELQQTPEFYHSLLNNCANGITARTYALTSEPIWWLDPRIVLPGYSGQFAYSNGLIGDREGGQSFHQLQVESRIDPLARKIGISPNFSQDIRRRILKLDRQGK